MKIRMFWSGRYTSKPMLKALFLFYSLIAITVIAVILGKESFFANDDAILPAFANSNSFTVEHTFLESIIGIVGFDAEKGKKMLNASIPLLEQINEKEKASIDTRQLIEKAIYAVAKVDVADPKSYMQEQIPFLVWTPYNKFDQTKKVNISTEEEVSKQDEPNESFHSKHDINDKNGSAEDVWAPHPWQGSLSEDVLVGIYHTHNSECYVPTSGVTHKAGALGDIFNVGEALKIFLEEEHGIRTYQSRQIHDYPALREAYGKSLHTAEAFVQKFPHLQMLLDVHRDARERKDTTTKISGQDVARILIVVGSNQSELEHKEWEKNYALALKINKKMEEMYPGLSRGIKIAEKRYNQHVSPNALLIEIGAHENSREEALRSAKLLADVLAAVIEEQKAGN